PLEEQAQARLRERLDARPAVAVALAARLPGALGRQPLRLAPRGLGGLVVFRRGHVHRPCYMKGDHVVTVWRLALHLARFRMIGIPLGLAYANAGEWLVHKYVLHGLGRKRSSYWSFHWLEHHRVSRLRDFYDPDYERSLLGWNAQSKEALALTGAAVAHLPL